MRPSFAVFLLFSVSLASAATPSVIKVEPPDWPAEPEPVTLRLLLTGSNLTRARVDAPFPTSRVRVSAAGTHLFVDIAVLANASPGAYHLRVDNGEGIAVARFAIVEPLPSAGAFRAFLLTM
jgi:hypothetical protein